MTKLARFHQRHRPVPLLDSWERLYCEADHEKAFLRLRPAESVLGAAASAQAPAEWKAAGKVNLPSPPMAAIVADDGSLLFVQTSRKIRRDSGGISPGFVDITTPRAYDVATGKERFKTDMGPFTD